MFHEHILDNVLCLITAVQRSHTEIVNAGLVRVVYSLKSSVTVRILHAFPSSGSHHFIDRSSVHQVIQGLLYNPPTVQKLPSNIPKPGIKFKFRKKYQYQSSQSLAQRTQRKKRFSPFVIFVFFICVLCGKNVKAADVTGGVRSTNSRKCSQPDIALDTI